MEKKTAEELRKEFESTSEYYAIYQDLGVVTPTMEYTQWLERKVIATQSRPEPSVGRYSESDLRFAMDAVAQSINADLIHKGLEVNIGKYINNYIATLTKQGSEEEGRGV